MLRPSNLSVKIVRLPSREVLVTDQVAAAADRDEADMEAVLQQQQSSSEFRRATQEGGAGVVYRHMHEHGLAPTIIV
jgi:hypothetical protein